MGSLGLLFLGFALGGLVFSVLHLWEAGTKDKRIGDLEEALSDLMETNARLRSRLKMLEPNGDYLEQ